MLINTSCKENNYDDPISIEHYTIGIMKKLLF